MRLAHLAALVAVCACSAPEVAVRGIVSAEMGAEARLEGADVLLRDGDYAVVDRAVTDAEGVFAVTAPSLSNVFLEFSGDGLIPIAFDGSSGLGETLDVGEGILWGFTEDNRSHWESLFVGCPGVGEGAFVIGEIHIDVATGIAPPIADQGFARVLDEENERFDACYLDAEGLAYDAEAVRTGASGLFGIFGLEPGPFLLVEGFHITDSSTKIQETIVWVPEDGVVTEFPALVTL